ncbi:MAG TPA: nucleotide disphospho-sugar-binding domain-containing protein [Steroidobacteraceae bacterium]|nr:nucleotide disphospho-sugar-binding domain-containing protein [Steroidobacteraceae bacterium]
MHVVYAWELGANLGHLERGIAIAESLREHEISCSFVVRDVRSSATLLSAHEFSFYAAPQCAESEFPPGRPSVSYSDVLLNVGWNNPDHLLAKVRAWTGLLELLDADAILIDHSPVALLAARVCDLPIFLVGTGFDVPPQQSPLPPLLADETSTAEQRTRSDRVVLTSINQVLDALGHPRMERVADLFADVPQYATTLPELDVYGVRPNVRYLGPVLPVSKKLQPRWEIESPNRGFAYLRTHTPGFENLMDAIVSCGLDFICVVPDATEQIIERFSSARVQVITHTVDVVNVLGSVRLVVSYGGAALVAQSLLAGVPMLLVTRVPEQVMNSERVVALGAGISITRAASVNVFASALRELIENRAYSDAAQRFAQTHTLWRPSTATEIASDIATNLHRAAVT